MLFAVIAPLTIGNWITIVVGIGTVLYFFSAGVTLLGDILSAMGIFG